MVGCLSIYNYITWIAGDTISSEEPDYTDRTPVKLHPLALTFPVDMPIEKYKKDCRESYEKMLEIRLRCAMRLAGYDPAEYGFDRTLCLGVIGDESVQSRKIFLDEADYPCEFCGGACTCSSESDMIAEADAGGSPSLVAQGFSSDRAASAGEQHEVPVEKADARGSLSLVAQGFSSDQAAGAGEQREVSVKKADAGVWPLRFREFTREQLASAYEKRKASFEKLSLMEPDLSEADDPSQSDNVCRVDKCRDIYLVINERGGYRLSNTRQRIPSVYSIKLAEGQLIGIRKFQVQKRGEETYDIVMVGCLNIYNYITWIAGDTISSEEPDYTDRTPVKLHPLALTFPVDMTVEKYKKDCRESYEKMLEIRLRCAMRDAGYDPAEYGFDRTLCLGVIGDESVQSRKIFLDEADYPCEFCGGAWACTCSSETELESG